MVCTISAGTSATYYISAQAKYYTGGKEPTGRWYAPSPSASVTNGAEIDDATFERLHAGLGSAGQKLTQNADGSHADRVTGYDITFSAPKSVSVLWGLGDSSQRQAVEAAHDAAVRATLGVINDNAAFSRRAKGGTILEPVQLTGAIFQHGEARPTERDDGKGGKALEADPQLHSHAVIFNWAQRADGSCGSIDGRQLFRWKMAAGAVYRAELAARLLDIGYGVDRVDDKGLFQIAGVPKSICDAFSGRRQSIVAAMREHGRETSDAPALAASVTRAVRKSKVVLSGVDRHEGWRARAAELEFEVPLPEMGAAKPERTVATTADILARLTETKAVFRRQDIFSAVAADLVGTAGVGSDQAVVLARRVQAVLEHAELVSLGVDALGQAAYSTKEMVALEQTLARTAHIMRRHRFGAVGRAPSATNITGPASALSDEQRAAFDHACGTGGLAVIEGAAGSGKTTLLSAIAKAYQDAGFQVIGSAVAWRAAQQLGEECGFESRALDSWLFKHREVQDVFTPQTVLFVDEAGLLSTRQMHAVLTAAQAGGSKVILAGDQRQLQAIGAGSGLAIVAGEVNAVRVDTNRRQKEAWARVAVSQLARGEAEPALRAFDEHGCLHWAAGQQGVVKTALELWNGCRLNHPDQSIAVLAKSNADVRALNAAMRAALRQSGKLRGNDVVVRAADRSGGAYDLLVAKGDRLEITTRNKELGVVNGTTGTVTRIEPGQNGHAQITLAVGSQAITFSTAELVDGRGRARLGHAYAATLYNSQGLTVDRAIVVGNAGFSANQAYVSASRARERTDIIVDAKEIERSLRAEARAKGNMMPVKPGPRDLLSRLAKGWARLDVKERAIIPVQRAHDLQRDVALEI